MQTVCASCLGVFRSIPVLKEAHGTGNDVSAQEDVHSKPSPAWISQGKYFETFSVPELLWWCEKMWVATWKKPLLLLLFVLRKGKLYSVLKP